MEYFIDGLIKKTKKKEIEWKPLGMMVDYNTFERELKDIHSIQSESLLEHINNRASYFFSYKEGYIVLCSVSIKDKIAGTKYDKLFLLTKICPVLSLDASGNYPYFQPKLETLKLIIEDNLYIRYSFPDVLYNFWNEVLK